jgi:hypothetical protein
MKNLFYILAMTLATQYSFAVAPKIDILLFAAKNVTRPLDLPVAKSVVVFSTEVAPKRELGVKE